MNHMFKNALLRPGDVFVDVGAHIGFFSLIASSLVGHTGKVYAFEANPSLRSFRSTRLNAPGWLSLAGPCGGKVARCFSSPREQGESGWGKLTTVPNEGNVISMQAISLDEWHMAEGFPPVRIVKIDAEGSELFIPQGARQLIARSEK